jgi:hypothetical protein
MTLLCAMTVVRTRVVMGKCFVSEMCVGKMSTIKKSENFNQIYIIYLTTVQCNLCVCYNI